MRDSIEGGLLCLLVLGVAVPVLLLSGGLGLLAGGFFCAHDFFRGK